MQFVRNSLLFGGILGFVSLFLMAFAFFSNTFPASLSSIHLTDGKRNIVYFQMSHIGTREYYKNVRSSLRALTQSGYVIYSEGVRPGTPESQAKFDATLGMKLSSGTYTEFADFVGMMAQDDTLFEGIPPEKILPVDLSLDEIVAFIGTGSLDKSTSPIDPTLEFARLREVSSGPLLPYIFRWLLNFTLSYLSGTDIFLDSLDSTLREAILTERNHHVIDTFLADVYGALHFEWMYAYLRSREPNWNIGTITPYYPYNK
jgi:hypothetical protein